MVWSKVAPANGKTHYVHRFGDVVIVNTNRKGALDSVPDGWEVVTTSSGNLRPRRT